jgi:hypothetical protein
MILKFVNRFVTDLYKIEVIRTFLGLIRFFILYVILRKGKRYKNSSENLDDHIKISRDNKILNVDDHNLHYAENLFNFKKTYNHFTGSKTKTIASPLNSIDFINFKASKVLSVGPRNEGELYYLRSLGFNWSNIFAIDLISYSSRITLGDIHETNYESNYFDIITCGWVIPYSNNYKKILDEIYRISANKCIISIGYTYTPEKIDKVRIYKSEEHKLNSNNQIINYYGNKIKTIYFNFDAYTDDKQTERHSILVFRINK